MRIGLRVAEAGLALGYAASVPKSGQVIETKYLRLFLFSMLKIIFDKKK